MQDKQNNNIGSQDLDNVQGEVLQEIRIKVHRKLLEILDRELASTRNEHIAFKHGAPRIGDVRRNFSDTRKARHQLGWQPSYRLEEGLKKTVAWFLHHYRY